MKVIHRREKRQGAQTRGRTRDSKGHSLSKMKSLWSQRRRGANGDRFAVALPWCLSAAESVYEHSLLRGRFDTRTEVALADQTTRPTKTMCFCILTSFGEIFPLPCVVVTALCIFRGLSSVITLASAWIGWNDKCAISCQQRALPGGDYLLGWVGMSPGVYLGTYQLPRAYTVEDLAAHPSVMW